MESNSSAIRVWAKISSWKKIIQYLVLSCFVTGKGKEITSYVQGAVNRLMSVSVKPPIRVASWSSVVLRVWFDGLVISFNVRPRTTSLFCEDMANVKQSLCILIFTSLTWPFGHPWMISIRRSWNLFVRPALHQYNDTSSYAVLYVLCKTSKTLQGIRRVRHRVLIKLCTFLSKTLIILELPYTRPVRPVRSFSWQVCSSLDWS